MAWDTLTAAMVAADAPVTTTVGNAIRNRLDFLNPTGTAIGTDLVNQLSILAAAVGQAELKTATETEATAPAAGSPVEQDVVTNAEFAFAVRGRTTNALASINYGWGNQSTAASASTAFIGFSEVLRTNQAFSVETIVRYVAASRPWGFGSIPDIGHSVFVRRLRATNEIRKIWACGDVPWNRTRYDLAALDKNHPGRMMAQPVPLGWAIEDLPPGEEIVMVDARSLSEYSVPIETLWDRVKAKHIKDLDEHLKNGISPEYLESLNAAPIPTKGITTELLVRATLFEIEHKWREITANGGLIEIVQGLMASDKNLSDDTSHRDHKHLPDLRRSDGRGLFKAVGSQQPLIKVITT